MKYKFITTNSHISKKMNFSLLHLCFALILHIGQSDGARILGFFTFPANSHFTCDNAIMRSLIKAGHEVTVVTPFAKRASLENYTSVIDVSQDTIIWVGKNTYQDLVFRSVYKFMNHLVNLEKPGCYKVMDSPEIQKILNSEEKLYDVVFVEMFALYQCFLPIAEKFGIPVIGIVTLRHWQYADDTISNVNHPAFIPLEMVTRIGKLSDIIGRLFNTWNYITTYLYKNYIISSVLQQFHEDHKNVLGSLTKYMNIKPSLIFYNNHFSLFSRPMNPNAIDIGGIAIKKANPLPKEIQQFIDEAAEGVILFSLGSVIRTSFISNETINAFKEAFAEIPQRVIWKYEDKMENVPNNVMILEWLPQRDILEHKNVKAFITHCGMGGTVEAVVTATPVITCPLFSDQIYNAESLEKLGIAVHLDINNISKKAVSNAINAIINNTSYYDTMQKVSKIFKDRPMTPEQSVVYWTEYVIRYQGAPHFATVASEVNWIQYLLLDVIFCALIFLVIFAFLIKLIIRYLCKMFWKNEKEIKNKIKKH